LRLSATTDRAEERNYEPNLIYYFSDIMKLNRRQFLMLAGAIGGCTIAGVRVSRSNQLNLSDSGLFAPPRGDLRIVVISDFNSAYGSTTYEPEVDRAIALIPDWQPDLVIGGGDMVAGQKLSLTPENIQAMWQAFDDRVASKLRQAGLPFGLTIGNHDGSGALDADGQFKFAQDRAIAAEYWQNPTHDPLLNFIDRRNFPFYYSFRLTANTSNPQEVFFLVWDASTAKISEDQLAWVEASLASPVAQSANLRIAIGHLPLYAVAVGRNKPGEILDNAEQLRLLLERYHVHTYISGHHHAYFPGHRGQLQLLHAGAIGSGPRQLLNSDRLPQKTLTVIDIEIIHAIYYLHHL
jgi:3',5'-cyclic AMP phosphodiesterase CpdA